MPHPWTARAACRGLDPDVFFPDPSSSEMLEVARRVCRDCPVQAPCLAFALANGEAGVWGGTDERERARMRERRR